MSAEYGVLRLLTLWCFSNRRPSNLHIIFHTRDVSGIWPFAIPYIAVLETQSMLWDFLLAKGDASGDIPSMRWEPYYNHDLRTVAALKKLPSQGYFLKDFEQFNALFFGISCQEAENMDPQQRMSVEAAWEALEDAGIAADSLAGTDIVLCMGVGTDDYSRLLFEEKKSP